MLLVAGSLQSAEHSYEWYRDEAKRLHLPRVVFVGQPGVEIPGCVCCSVDALPARPARCVIVRRADTDASHCLIGTPSVDRIRNAAGVPVPVSMPVPVRC